jgi:hypothetical protein
MSQIKGFGRALYSGHYQSSLGHVLHETHNTVLFLEDGYRTPFWTSKAYVIRFPVTIGELATRV